MTEPVVIKQHDFEIEINTSAKGVIYAQIKVRGFVRDNGAADTLGLLREIKAQIKEDFPNVVGL